MGAKGPRVTKRTRAELVTMLAEQRAALATSCGSFDEGNDWEAARLAITIFNLVHDDRKIISLLTQLGLRASLRFVSSGRDESDKYVKLATPPLVMGQFNMGTGKVCVPRLD